MVLLFFIALFIIVWFSLGGLRSNFGKALMLFSFVFVVGLLLIFVYAVNLSSKSAAIPDKPDFLTNYNTYHPTPY